MGSISGWLIAKCKNCNCRFNWHIDNAWPFVDSEIIGTCNKCINKESHTCIDELTLDANDCFMKVGEKKFPKKKQYKRKSFSKKASRAFWSEDY